MNRRAFLGTLVGFLAAPRAAEAQQAGKIHRIGVLDTSPVERNAANLDDVNEPVCLLGSARTSGVRPLLMTRVAAGSPVAVGLR